MSGNAAGFERIAGPVRGVVQGVVGAYAATFGEAFVAAYVLGSSVDGSWVPGSDVDAHLIFADDAWNEALQAQARALRQALGQLSPLPLEMGELPASGRIDHQDLREDERLHLAGVLVYGTELRDRWPLVPVEEARVEFARGALLRVALRRGLQRVPAEVAAPDPDDEYCGYLAPGRISPEPGPKQMVQHACWLATATLALRYGRYAGSRKRCVDLLLDLEPEGRARYLSWLHQRCKMEWHWRMPTEAAERGELRAMCGQMLRFERAFLDDVAEFAEGADNRVRTRLREVWAGV